jgi:hypothetical protein
MKMVTGIVVELTGERDVGGPDNTARGDKAFECYVGLVLCRFITRRIL